MSLIVGAAVLSLAGNAMSAVGGYRDAAQQAKEMERQAGQARRRGLEDFNIASLEVGLQENQLIDTATMEARQLELQHEQMAAESLQGGGQMIVEADSRGVSGGGTSRMMRQNIEGMARKYEGFTLSRTATFNRHSRGMRAMALNRQRLGLQLDRLGEDTRDMEKKAKRTEQAAWKNMWMGITGAAIGAGTQAGLGLYEAGGPGKGGKGVWEKTE